MHDNLARLKRSPQVLSHNQTMDKNTTIRLRQECNLIWSTHHFGIIQISAGMQFCFFWDYCIRPCLKFSYSSSAPSGATWAISLALQSAREFYATVLTSIMLHIFSLSKALYTRRNIA